MVEEQQYHFVEGQEGETEEVEGSKNQQCLERIWFATKPQLVEEEEQCLEVAEVVRFATIPQVMQGVEERYLEGGWFATKV